MLTRAIPSLLLGLSLSAQAQAPQAQPKPAGKVEVLWLGQSAIRLTTPGGKVIVIDPFLTKNPKTPPQYKDLDALGKIDLLLVTHAHGDHLGDAVALSKKHNVQLYGPAGLCQSLITLGELPATLAIRMNKSGTVTPLGPGIRVTEVHAEHSSELVWHNPVTDKTRPTWEASRSGSSSSWRTGSASTTWATPGSSATCG